MKRAVIWIGNRLYYEKKNIATGATTTGACLGEVAELPDGRTRIISALAMNPNHLPEFDNREDAELYLRQIAAEHIL